MNLYRWLAVLALTAVASQAFAQVKNCNNYFCSDEESKKWDEEFERQSAPGRAERARQQAENDAALKA